MPATYSFVSTWHLPVRPRATWDELGRALAPGVGGTSWWPGFTVLMAPRQIVAGERMIIAVRSPLGYTLRLRLEISDVEPRRAIAASSGGDLRGRGSVHIHPAPGDASVVVFRWEVETARAWMNATAWLLRPVFERAHARVMRRGERGLRAALGSPGGSELRNAGNVGVPGIPPASTG